MLAVLQQEQCFLACAGTDCPVPLAFENRSNGVPNVVIIIDYDYRHVSLPSSRTPRRVSLPHAPPGYQVGGMPDMDLSICERGVADVGSERCADGRPRLAMRRTVLVNVFEMTGINGL